MNRNLTDRTVLLRHISIAARHEAPGKGLPSLLEWERALPVTFCSDWRGENADPQRETQVQLLWSDDHIFVRFHCRYRVIYVYKGANSRRDKLWLRDVAEIFIGSDSDEPQHYREFEISPNGDWLDLDIVGGEKSFLHCDLTTRVAVNPDTETWTAELAIPICCLTSSFDLDGIWRLNLFRIEGREPNRFYSAWQPTYTSQPNFHVPESFGTLYFENPGNRRLQRILPMSSLRATRQPGVSRSRRSLLIKR